MTVVEIKRACPYCGYEGFERPAGCVGATTFDRVTGDLSGTSARAPDDGSDGVAEGEVGPLLSRRWNLRPRECFGKVAESVERLHQ